MASTNIPEVGRPERSSVVASAEEAVEVIEDGMTVAIGGILLSSRPMALIRALIRRGVRDLTVVGGAMAGLDVDLMIGAGLVRKIVAGTVGAGPIAHIAPWFRRSAERGTIEVWECDEISFYLALRAAALDAPFLPWRAGLGTSLPEVNSDLRVIEDPFGSGPVIAVPAIRPDVALLHAAYADAFGNVQHVAGGFADVLMDHASNRTVVQVEQIVSNDRIRQRPEATTIFGASAVVHTPYGAHPTASPGFYLFDEDRLNEYVAAARSAETDEDQWQAWLRHDVLDHPNHLSYLEKIGIKELVRLHES